MMEDLSSDFYRVHDEIMSDIQNRKYFDDVELAYDLRAIAIKIKNCADGGFRNTDILNPAELNLLNKYNYKIW